MFNRVWFKKLAKEQIGPNLVTLGLMFLIYYGIAMGVAIVSTFFMITTTAIAGSYSYETQIFAVIVSTFIMIFVIWAVAAPFMVSFFRAYLMLTRGERVIVSDIFWAFRSGDRLWGSIKLFYLILIYTLLWSLLFIVPGIIRALDYSQAFFIFSDDPSKGARQCLSESIYIMKGHRMDVFIMQLSFILWAFTMYIPIAGIFIFLGYVFPYIMSTYANAHRFLHDEKFANGFDTGERYLS
jgi:uncharacterized membrane protein